MSSNLVITQALKNKIRNEIASSLRSLSSAEKQRQSEIVCEKLFNLQIFKDAKRISTYLSFEEEINTSSLIEKIFASSKECFIPRYRQNEMQMVKLRSIVDWRNLPKNKMGIKQPNFNENRENALETGGLDLFIIPGVAFTSNGFRLGRGRGHYDTFFNQYNNRLQKLPPIIALAFKEQIVDQLPIEEHDFKVDIVLYVD